MLWLSDFNKLYELVARAEKNADQVAHEVYRVESQEGMNVVDSWLSQSSTDILVGDVTSDVGDVGDPGTPGPPPRKRRRMHRDLGLPPRSATAAEAARERDFDECVVTHAAGATEVAPIFPFALRDTLTSTSSSPFWKVLRLFWSAERVDSWIASLAGSEGPQNLITLAPSVHAYWRNALMCFKPISMSDKDTLEMEFCWLKGKVQGHRKADIQIGPDSPFGTDRILGTTKLYDCETDEKMCTGTKIIMMTSYAAKLPLPDLCILQMQYLLDQVAAIRGARKLLDGDEWFDGEWWSDDDGFGVHVGSEANSLAACSSYTMSNEAIRDI